MTDAQPVVLHPSPARDHSPPRSDLDLWSETALADPNDHYAELRQLGPVVWLTRNEAWALTHYKAVREALRTPDIFSSAQGCMMNAVANKLAGGTTMLCTDDPMHRQLRNVFARPLLPAAVTKLRARLAEMAEAQIAEIVVRGRAEVVGDLAQYLPLAVVTGLVGLSEAGKTRMLEWAAGMFDAFGPDDNERTASGLQITADALNYAATVPRDELDPQGWGAALFAAADRGEIPPEAARGMLIDYIGPSLDTTILATASALALFARHPEQWDRLRNEPSLLQGAVEEALRLAAPIRAFSRVVTRDTELEEVNLHAGDRALLIYASANRDERRFPDPNRFDIARRPQDHLTFGFGTHFCAGANLARMELTVLLQALLVRVARMEIVEYRPMINNTLQGPAYLLVNFCPAAVR